MCSPWARHGAWFSGTWRADAGSFLPIGGVACSFVRGVGDLLTLTHGRSASSVGGFILDPIQGIPHRPPRRLPFPVKSAGLAVDGPRRIVAAAAYGATHVLTPVKAFKVGPLDNCRYVAVSPDGKWLATGSHDSNGAQVWQISDGALVANLKVEGLVGVAFSSDGKWLMTRARARASSGASGTWEEALTNQRRGLTASPPMDGFCWYKRRTRRFSWSKPKQAATSRDLKVLTCACAAGGRAFRPRRVIIVVVTNDGPAVHVWDLRAIRKHLVKMGLDWEAPPYPEVDPSWNEPLPRLDVLPAGADPRVILEQQRSQ